MHAKILTLQFHALRFTKEPKLEHVSNHIEQTGVWQLEFLEGVDGL